GTVGTDDGVQLSYTDASGAHTGTITVNHGDVGNLLNVAEGVKVQFGAGTLVNGDTFAVKTYVPTIQDAADASVTLGDGAGAMTVTSATNQIDSLIPGVALNLLAADPAKTIRLSVTSNVDGMRKGIGDFVNAFNGLMADIDDKMSYNADTQQAGPLLGNRQVQSIQEQVRGAVTDIVAGANPKLNHLGALGLRLGDNGRIGIDEAKLSSVLNGGVDGVSIGDVRKLFALTGTTSNPGVQFATGSAKTVASTTPYTVQITQAADRASLTASTAASASTVIDNTNNSLTVKVDGATSATLTLAAGTYTRLALSQALQAAINADTALAGRRVSVGLVGDKISVTSERYGSGSQVVMQSGSALAPLGFTAGDNAQGHDVAGSFVVNSITETAHGSGQLLIGDTGNTHTADLQLRVSLTAAQVGGGAQATVTVSRGIASRLDAALTGLLDIGNGRLKLADDSFQESLDRLAEQKTTQTNLMLARQESLQLQFAAMENTLSQLQAASNFISAQSASLTKKQ
ncbi:MAG: flagellar filament capping protein FliD, partial [Planctomycetes bacterium]|nr:flagellar filament capping protein FliD [Planctomycetota bacterium]